MKRNLKISSVMLLLISILFSCNVDDDSPETALEQGLVEIEAQFDLVRINSPSFQVPFTLTRAVNQPARVYYTLDGGAEQFLDLPIGTLSVEIPVSLEGRDFTIVTITRIAMLYANSENVRLNVSENNSTTVVNGDDFVASIAWDTGEDIDLLLVREGYNVPLASNDPEVVDGAFTLSPVETVRLANGDIGTDPGVVTLKLVAAGFNELINPVSLQTSIVGDTVDQFIATMPAGPGAQTAGGFIFNNVSELATIQVNTGDTYSYTVSIN